MSIGRNMLGWTEGKNTSVKCKRPFTYEEKSRLLLVGFDLAKNIWNRNFLQQFTHARTIARLMQTSFFANACQLELQLGGEGVNASSDKHPSDIKSCQPCRRFPSEGNGTGWKLLKHLVQPRWNPSSKVRDYRLHHSTPRMPHNSAFPYIFQFEAAKGLFATGHFRASKVGWKQWSRSCRTEHHQLTPQRWFPVRMEDQENMLIASVSGGSHRNHFLMGVCTFKVVIWYGIFLMSTCFSISQGLFCIYKQ